MSDRGKQLANYKAARVGQIEPRPVKRRKKHAKNEGDWKVIVNPDSTRPWVRSYPTQAMAEQVCNAYNRRFSCHPYTGKEWGGKHLRAILVEPAPPGQAKP